MRLLSEVRERVRSLLFRRRQERELAEELRFHLEMEAEANMRRGMAGVEARRAALRRFGGVDRHAEAVRDERGVRVLEDMGRDVRYAVRSLVRARAFTLAAVVVLGLGTGGTAALFTAVSSLFLHPAPGVAPDARRVWITPRERGRATMLSFPDYEDASGVRPFEAATAFGNTTVSVASGGPAERVQAQLVTPGYFAMFGVRPLRGRGFLADETSPGRAAVVVLSERLWRRAFSADPGVVGRSVKVDGRPFTVVGIAPAEFTGPEVGDLCELWLPIAAQPLISPDGRDLRPARRSGWLTAVGRLRPGANAVQATAALAHLAQPAEHWSIGAAPMRSGMRPGNGAALPGIIVGAVVTLLVLLIACSNFATLLIGRGAGRRAELAMRRTLGAGRSRILRLLLTEVALVTLAGGTLGVLLSVGIAAGLEAAVGMDGARLVLHPDRLALAAALGLALVSGLLFGVAPAVQATRPDPLPALRDAGAGGDRRASRLRRGLVVAQVALSMLLLVTAGLLLRSLGNAMRADTGFDAGSNALLASFDPALQGYAPARRAAFEDELLRRVRELPGVAAATLATDLPLSGMSSGARAAADGGAGVEVSESTTRPGLFRALGDPLVAGRDFTAADGRGASAVVVVNESVARLLFGRRSPLGRRVRVGYGTDALNRTIIGVARDAVYDSPGEPPQPFVFLPLLQVAPEELARATLVVRSASGDASILTGPVRAVFRDLDPDMPVFDVRTFADQIAQRLAPRRVATRLIALFGALALLLSAVGLYGLTAYSVARRTREVGVRVALGARPGEVLRLFLGEGVRLSAAGVAIGLPLALVLTRFLSSMLYGVGAADLATFATAAAVLGGAALLASAIPARRATRIDAMRALRVE